MVHKKIYNRYTIVYNINNLFYESKKINLVKKS